jgi:hypothetical protein
MDGKSCRRAEKGATAKPDAPPHLSPKILKYRDILNSAGVARSLLKGN